MKLSFSDGFQFGCGFFAATVVFWILLIILAVILTFAFGALGLAIPKAPMPIPPLPR